MSQFRDDIEHILNDPVEQSQSRILPNKQRRQERLRKEMQVLLRDVEEAMHEAAKIRGPRARLVQQRVIDELRGLPLEAWHVFRQVRKETYLRRALELEKHPDIVPDKLQRVIMLSNLRYGTPAWEIQAGVDRMLSDLDVLGLEEAPVL